MDVGIEFGWKTTNKGGKSSGQNITYNSKMRKTTTFVIITSSLIVIHRLSLKTRNQTINKQKLKLWWRKWKKLCTKEKNSKRQMRNVQNARKHDVAKQVAIGWVSNHRAKWRRTLNYCTQDEDKGQFERSKWDDKERWCYKKNQSNIK